MNTVREIAVFGGGCFWCTEAVFKMLKGVQSVTPGYAGGHSTSSGESPTYKDVSSGKTGHAEVVRIEFNPSEISYSDLLTVFFAIHDSTTPNRQGNDIGTQYRSIILYANDNQKKRAEAFIEDLGNEGGDPIVTEVKPLGAFYEAETYHKDYYERNREKPYCQIFINPKIEKVQKKFAELLNSIPLQSADADSNI